MVLESLLGANLFETVEGRKKKNPFKGPECVCLPICEEVESLWGDEDTDQ